MYWEVTVVHRWPLFTDGYLPIHVWLYLSIYWCLLNDKVDVFVKNNDDLVGDNTDTDEDENDGD